MKLLSKLAFSASAICLVAVPTMAQDEVEVTKDPAATAYEGTVFDGDWISIGAGVVYSPSYEGSDNYVISPLPIVQGEFGGIGIDPRPGGLALDFIPESEGKVDISAGISARLVRNRVDQIEDEVVKLAGELDTAVEVGPTFGVSFPQLLNPYDSLTLATDVRFDVAGAHEGATISPSLTYFTPLSRGIAASLSLSTNWIDNDQADYYFSIDGATAAATGLPAFDADSGFRNWGITLFAGIDLDGDVTNGGLAIAVIGSYSRLLGDFKDTPFTSVRGDADQFMIGGGLGYTF